jgi:hypothetical protein
MWSKPKEDTFYYTPISNMEIPKLKRLLLSVHNPSNTVVLDMGLREEFLPDLDLAHVTFIDHHKSSEKFVDKFKKAKVIYKEYSSNALLTYRLFKENITATDAQKTLIALTDDYDSYRLELPNSYDLNIIFWSEYKNKFAEFIKDYYNGFKPFTDSQKRAIAYLRKEAKEEGNQVLQQLWKELANSMYGKLAQGLRKRNVFNVSKLESEELPECKITTPFYAAYTTSFCRAVLGEILNKLPKSVAVCSCTTDGFLCTVDADQIKKATSGPLSKEFLKARQYFNPNEKSILEVKSVIRKPLGWRTRGQATLLPKNLKESDTFVLAKAGLKPEAYDKLEQNKWIIETFEKRFFGQKYAVRSFVSVRDMFEDESDLYSINSDKAISMDFDWKRRPVMDSLEMRKVRTSQHVFFDTVPWKTAKESEDCKDDWKKFAELNQRCLKTEEDVREFIEFYTHRASLPKVEGRNNPRKGNIPFRKFKIWFARAYANGAYGLPPKTDGKRPSYEKLDVFFSQRGLKGMRGALSNYRTDDVDPPNQTPRSAEMEKIVTDLLELFPNFEVDSVFITVP